MDATPIEFVVLLGSCGYTADVTANLLISASGSPQDTALRNELLRHLTPLVKQAALEIWSRDCIPIGRDIIAEFRAAARKANIALVLLSPDFFADHRADAELAELLELQKQGLRLVPVLLRAVDWQVHESIARLQVLPRDGTPLASLDPVSRDQALVEIARALVAIAGHLANVPPTGGGSGGPPPRGPEVIQGQPGVSPHWGLFVLLTACLMIVLGLGIFYGPRVLRGQAIAHMALLLGLFSLLAAVVLSGMLGSAGLWKPTSGVALGGAAAIWMAIFTSLVAAVIKLSPLSNAEWVARGEVNGLPEGRTAWISANGCPDVQIDNITSRFALPINGPCDQPDLLLSVRVENHGTQQFHISKVNTQEKITLTWKPSTAAVNNLTGIVLASDKRPIRGASVRFESPCPDVLTVLPATTALDGTFLLDRIPPECRRPPYLLRVYLDGSVQTVPFSVDHAWGNILQLPEGHLMHASQDAGVTYLPAKAVVGRQGGESVSAKKHPSSGKNVNETGRNSANPKQVDGGIHNGEQSQININNIGKGSGTTINGNNATIIQNF